MKCKYGCGNDALFGERCAKSNNSCPINRAKNSAGGQIAWKTKKPFYSSISQEARDRMAWSRGLRKETDARVLAVSMHRKGVRKISDPEALKKVCYRDDCEFQINWCIESIPGYEKLKSFGMFHPITNRGGAVRDHRFSVHYGYMDNVCPSIMSHPANCRFLLANENSKKGRKSEITLGELMKEIQEWDRRFGLSVVKRHHYDRRIEPATKRTAEQPD